MADPVAPSNTAEAATSLPSKEVIAHWQETFQFVRHEREDVRKMAIHGIAEHSKDNKDLWAFLASPQYGPSCIDSLLQYLHAGGKNILGDILSILVNCSADGSCAEMLVQRKVVRKAMRLLDGMERSDQPESYVRSVQELTLMLLNNLTASHVSAVDDLLQKEDEDMRGFYLGKLQVYYERLQAEADKNDKADETPEAEAEQVKDEKKNDGAAAPHRDLQRWILHILLNLTRSSDGQELLLEDDDWRGTLCSSLSAVNPRHRYLAAQCYRNCACGPSPLYPLLLKSNALVTAVDRLNLKEPIAEIQLILAEFVASMLECEEGVALLESVNAKKLLVAAVAESKPNENAHPRVEEVEENEEATGRRAAKPLAANVCEFLELSVLPYLDEIVDAYMAPGSDELD